jgi:hypothetical protein
MSMTRDATRAQFEQAGDGGRLLKTAMKGNALVSAVTAAILMAGASGLDSWSGVNPWVLAGVGLGLLTYAVDLVWWARSSRWLRLGGRIAVVADIGWVVGAVLLIALTEVLTGPGETVLAILSAVVAAFAAAQWMGLERLNSGR